MDVAYRSGIPCGSGIDFIRGYLITGITNLYLVLSLLIGSLSMIILGASSKWFGTNRYSREPRGAEHHPS